MLYLGAAMEYGVPQPERKQKPLNQSQIDALNKRNRQKLIDKQIARWEAVSKLIEASLMSGQSIRRTPERKYQRNS